MGVIARPAGRITCQRARPRRTTTEPRPDLGDETHHVSRAVEAIHPGLVRSQLEIRKDTARGARGRPLAGRSPDAVSIAVPRLAGISRLATLSASGHSKEGR